MNLIQHKGELFQIVQAGPWEGMKPLQVEKTGESGTTPRWHGHQIKMAQVHQISTFFARTYELTKGETMIHGFYHEEHGWCFMPLPQQGYTGMTVKLLEDHPNRIPTFQRLGEGWSIMGTWHHHCATSAFQSSTDHTDEKTKEGLHVTLGNIGSAKMTMHARTSLWHRIDEARLSDWFELDERLFELVPFELHDQILRHQICTPHPEVAYPEWWNDNVVKVVYPTRNYVGCASDQPKRWERAESRWDKHQGRHAFDWERNDAPTPPANSHIQALPPRRDQSTVDEDITNLMNAHGATLDDVEQSLDALDRDDFTFDLAVTLGEHQCRPERLLADVRHQQQEAYWEEAFKDDTPRAQSEDAKLSDSTQTTNWSGVFPPETPNATG